MLSIFFQMIAQVISNYDLNCEISIFSVSENHLFKTTAFKKDAFLSLKNRQIQNLIKQSDHTQSYHK